MSEASQTMQMSWRRFALMVVTSTFVMFLLMYHLVYSLEHVLFSLTRLLTALVMGCVMTALMLAFMWKMYGPNIVKLGVLGVAVISAVTLLVVNRSQTLVGDVDFLKAMIPHHSIAINNARKADLRDPRVRYLADRITRDQVKEIAEMEMLLTDIHQLGRRGNAPLMARSANIDPEAAEEARRLLSGQLLKDEPL